MRNCDYIAAKQAIQNGKPISAATLQELKDLLKEYQKAITKETLTGDVKKAMYFNEHKMEIVGLIHDAVVSIA